MLRKSLPTRLDRVIILALFLMLLPASSHAAEDIPPFRDPNLSVEQRVDDLISRLTLEEKVPLLTMGNPAIPRLGIPAYCWWNEALHGVARNGTATVFPQAIGMAATWNPELIHKVADVISTEARAKNNETLAQSGGDTQIYQGLTIWSPNINIFRDPRWGRGQETYGEDPFLSSRLAIAFIQGLQGDNPDYLKTVATVKHFAVHSGPEVSRHYFDAKISERDLRETYLPAFEAGIREGGALSLMSAYNAVNGVPAPANTNLLQKILREEWGFKGAVVGDVDNVSDMWREGGHKYCPDDASASATALRAGNDLCSGGTYWALFEALKRGLATEADLDRALRHLLSLRFRLGHFDPEGRVPYRAIPASANNSAAHDQLALETARQSIVLLKNDHTLPFDIKKLKTVALIGPTANETSVILGNYSGTPSKLVTLAESLRSRLESQGVTVLIEPGAALVNPLHPGGNPIQQEVLFTDATRTTPGLQAEFFAHATQDEANPQVEGTQTTTRTDHQVNYFWNEAQPSEGIPLTNAGARWTGVLVPPTTGEYKLGVIAEGAVRLHIDKRLVIDSWKPDKERALEAKVSLEAGRAYDLAVEYVQLSPNGKIQLGWIPPDSDERIERALEAGRKADHIVLALGITPNLEGEEMSVNAEGFFGGDRQDIRLPAPQRELLTRLAKLRKPMAVVLTGGSALSFDDSKAGAFLQTWYFGQRGAEAVTDVLLGTANPAGRLPITFYRNVDDLPAFDDYSMQNRTYRYFEGKPLYAFGHGLSYTKFAYKNISLSTKKARPSEQVTVAVKLRNSGKRDGDEVVQLYASAKNAPVAMPKRQLIAFQRVTIKAGETKTVSFTVPIQRLRRWDERTGSYIIDACSWNLEAGPASDKLPLRVTLKIAP